MWGCAAICVEADQASSHHNASSTHKCTIFSLGLVSPQCLTYSQIYYILKASSHHNASSNHKCTIHWASYHHNASYTQIYIIFSSGPHLTMPHLLANVAYPDQGLTSQQCLTYSQMYHILIGASPHHNASSTHKYTIFSSDPHLTTHNNVYHLVTHKIINYLYHHAHNHQCLI